MNNSSSRNQNEEINQIEDIGCASLGTGKWILATVFYERTNREICLPSRNQNMARELMLTGGNKNKQEKQIGAADLALFYVQDTRPSRKIPKSTAAVGSLSPDERHTKKNSIRRWRQTHRMKIKSREPQGKSGSLVPALREAFMETRTLTSGRTKPAEKELPWHGPVGRTAAEETSEPRMTNSFGKNLARPSRTAARE
jgi:hypothetical protein